MANLKVCSFPASPNCFTTQMKLNLKCVFYWSTFYSQDHQRGPLHFSPEKIESTHKNILYLHKASFYVFFCCQIHASSWSSSEEGLDWFLLLCAYIVNIIWFETSCDCVNRQYYNFFDYITAAFWPHNLPFIWCNLVLKRYSLSSPNLCAIVIEQLLKLRASI